MSIPVEKVTGLERYSDRQGEVNVIPVVSTTGTPAGNSPRPEAGRGNLSLVSALPRRLWPRLRRQLPLRRRHRMAAMSRARAHVDGSVLLRLQSRTSPSRQWTAVMSAHLLRTRTAESPARDVLVQTGWSEKEGRFYLLIRELPEGQDGPAGRCFSRVAANVLRRQKDATSAASSWC